jgi:hypothetical protein
MRDSIEDFCENIDSAMFSGDEFLNENNRKTLIEYMERWTRELKRIDNMVNSEEYKKEMQDE